MTTVTSAVQFLTQQEGKRWQRRCNVLTGHAQDLGRLVSLLESQVYRASEAAEVVRAEHVTTLNCVDAAAEKCRILLENVLEQFDTTPSLSLDSPSYLVNDACAKAAQSLAQISSTSEVILATSENLPNAAELMARLNRAVTVTRQSNQAAERAFSVLGSSVSESESRRDYFRVQVGRRVLE